MKKLMLLASMAALFTVNSSAAVINIVCTPAPLSLLGQSGSGTETCSAPVIPVGDNVVSITIRYAVQILGDPFSNLSTSATFNFDGPAGYDFGGTANAGAGTTFSPVINVAAADFGLFLSGFTINDTYAGASTATEGASFNKQIVVTTETPSTVIPEPSSMALLGSALVGLGVLARRRK